MENALHVGALIGACRHDDGGPAAAPAGESFENESGYDGVGAGPPVACTGRHRTRARSVGQDHAGNDHTVSFLLFHEVWGENMFFFSKSW